MKITALIKEKSGLNCGCMNEYEGCDDCNHAGEKVEIEESLTECLNASDNTKLYCTIKDGDGQYIAISKKNLENWEWSLESDY